MAYPSQNELAELDEEFIEESSKPELGAMDLQHISVDPHLHSAFSDGPRLYHSAKTAQKLGLSDMIVTDHMRQRFDDIDFYNLDAYVIKMGLDSDEEDFVEEEWLMPYNLDILSEVVDRHNQDTNDINMHLSVEQDYESWNEDLIEDFFANQPIEICPLSLHYLKIDEWDKAKYFRAGEFDELSESSLAEAAGVYVNEYENKIEFGSRVEDMQGISVIQTHLGGVLRNENLRPHIRQEDLHHLLDMMEEHDAVAEFNARTLRKLSQEYGAMGAYSQEDAEWLPREILRRAEYGDLDFVISSDAHSAEDMKQGLRMADKLVGDYKSQPLNYQELKDRV